MTDVKALTGNERFEQGGSAWPKKWDRVGETEGLWSGPTCVWKAWGRTAVPCFQPWGRRWATHGRKVGRYVQKWPTRRVPFSFFFFFLFSFSYFISKFQFGFKFKTSFRLWKSNATNKEISMRCNIFIYIYTYYINYFIPIILGKCFKHASHIIYQKGFHYFECKKLDWGFIQSFNIYLV
jgi:hypothetical protein